MCSAKMADLEGEFANVPLDPAESRKYIRNILDKFQSVSSKPDNNTSGIATNSALINKCFGEHVTSVEEIMQKLSEEEATGNEWAKKTLSVSFYEHCFLFPFGLKSSGGLE